MSRPGTHGILTLAGVVVALSGGALAQSPAPRPSVTPAASHTASPDGEAALIRQYCTTCHNDRMKTGGLSLAAYDPSKPEHTPAVSEKIIRKLRAGMMPPPGVKRPDAETLTALVTALETRVDRAAAASPDPGYRPFQRLNRAEYARAVHDLLALDVDVTAFLPPDTIAHGFDNIADEQSFSPALMEGYLRAAGQISRLAVGDRTASAGSSMYHIARTASQMRRVDGAPIGTRGGISVVHVFPADGEYVFKMLLHSGPTGDIFGGATRGEQIEVSINGARVALLPINHLMRESDPGGLMMQTAPIHVKAGPQRVSAAFIKMSDGPVDDLIRPIEHTLADTNIGETFGITGLPHLREFAVTGPHAVTGVSDTPSRRRIFTCRPTAAREEATCATAIINRLARQAYRGTATRDDLADLMRLYEQGRSVGDFESGIRLALQGMLANPRFLFRLEQAAASAKASAKQAGDSAQAYRISDIALASRLSFFLWGTVPDAELVQLAIDGTLHEPAVLDAQVRRMLADARSEAVATRFASQWLRLQDVDKVRPDPLLFPQWDHTLTTAFIRETELFFDSLVRENRGVLDLLTADYTFVNERLAKHYGIPNVMGNEFRRVKIPQEHRRGILGQGSILLLTSVADRTSPVLRGKWVMEVLLGTPPPPPPPNVPTLEETKAAVGAKLLSVRERMEEHRANPACNSCHRVIDPLGLALENYDATGAWRIKDNGVQIDPRGELYDGTKMSGPEDLRTALLSHADAILLSFTESLLTYALGRQVEAADMPTVRAIVRDAAGSKYTLSSFISGVVKSAAFQMRRVESTERTEASGGTLAQPGAGKASRR